jgi:hypothetical protein
MPGSFKPSKILGGSGLTDAATASSNWLQILHGICLYPLVEAYTTRPAGSPRELAEIAGGQFISRRHDAS